MISARQWERKLTAACDYAARYTNHEILYRAIPEVRASCAEKALWRIEMIDHLENRPNGVTEKTVNFLRTDSIAQAIAWRVEHMHLARFTMTHNF